MNNTDIVLKSLHKRGESSVADIAKDTGLTKSQVGSTLYVSIGRLVGRHEKYRPYVYYLKGPGVTRARRQDQHIVKLNDAKTYITEQFKECGDSAWLEGWICGVTDSILNSANEFMYEELFDHLRKLRKG